MKKNLAYSAGLYVLLAVGSCTRDKGIPGYNKYPDDIGRLVFTKCATPGCHTDASKGATAGLSLESWDKLFEGGTGGAAVIPFRHEYSSFFTYTNIFNDLGLAHVPAMPFNKEPLTRAEVVMIKDWITAGAPDRDGIIKFADNPNRKKVYVVNQGCDVVTVFDQETLLPMRYIDVGNTSGIESPHMIKVAPDGQFWYVISLNGNSLRKYRTGDDSFVGEATIGSNYWNTLTISNNGQKAYVVDWSSTGDIAVVDLNALTVEHNAGFNFPHGSCLNPAGDTLYVTQQEGSKVYKMPVDDFSAFIEVNLFSTSPASALKPHEVLFSPDGSKYFVTCQGTSELRVFQQGTDQLLAVIPVGGMPSEMAVSAAKNLLFVSCTEDISSFPGKTGSVAVIDIGSNALIHTIYTGHQPHGLAVDDAKSMVYVANRNSTQDGPAPHHSGVCAGRNGYMTFINTSTLTLVKNGANDKKVEISVDPYSVALRP